MDETKDWYNSMSEMAMRTMGTWVEDDGKEHKCVLCGKAYTGFGHNPEPFADMSKDQNKRACEECAPFINALRMLNMNMGYTGRAVYDARMYRKVFKKYKPQEEQEIPVMAGIDERLRYVLNIK